MILKWETSDGSWAYFGNAQAIFVDKPRELDINEVYTRQGSPGDIRTMVSASGTSNPAWYRHIHFLFDGKDGELYTPNAVYLLNDLGKTVERIN